MFNRVLIQIKQVPANNPVTGHHHLRGFNDHSERLYPLHMYLDLPTSYPKGVITTLTKPSGSQIQVILNRIHL